MWCRQFAVLACLTVSAGAARADMGTPGVSRVPHDFVIEVESGFPGYRFWLVSPHGIEPLDLARGRPFRIDGEGRTGSHRIAYIVAAPIALVEETGKDKFEAALWPRKFDADGRLPPTVIWSESIDFLGQVPFYDTRERVIDRCRLEFVPGQHVRLVWLEENSGSTAVKRAWLAAGVLVPVAVLSGGWWAVRRVRRTLWPI